MVKNINAIKGTPRAIGKRVLVTDVEFGEQVTESGLIIAGDDGKERGIYPRWGKVYSKGPKNIDDYKVGEWILIEHGRWSRSMQVEFDDAVHELRMIETESVLAYSNEKPSDTYIGKEYGNGDSVDTNFHTDAMAS